MHIFKYNQIFVSSNNQINVLVGHKVNQIGPSVSYFLLVPGERMLLGGWLAFDSQRMATYIMSL